MGANRDILPASALGGKRVTRELPLPVRLGEHWQHLPGDVANQALPTLVRAPSVMPTVLSTNTA